MKRSGFLLLCALMVSGCGNQIEDFVRKDPLKGVGDTPSLTTEVGPAIKLSPGANQVSGTALKARFSITATNRVLTGNQVKATVSVSQSHPK